MFHLHLSRRSRLASLLGACALLWPVSASLFAGQPDAIDAIDASGGKDKNITQSILDEITPLNVLEAEGSYVGKSDFHTHSVNGEDQSEIESSIEYGHRFQLVGRTYLKLGFAYERFDFSTSAVPVPTTLQSIAGLVAVEYVVQGKPGLFITSRPGVYFSDDHDITLGNFDAPTAFGGIIPVHKNIYLLLGARASLLSNYPVLPFAGLVWIFNDHLRLEGVPPNPRLIYSVNEKLDFFLGGEILGDAFKRDKTNYGGRNQRFSGGVIDYGEYRVGAGLTYTPIKQIDIDFTGGWVFEREFNYYRGDDPKNFTTTGAPYARIGISAEF